MREKGRTRPNKALSKLQALLSNPWVWISELEAALTGRRLGDLNPISGLLVVGPAASGLGWKFVTELPVQSSTRAPKSDQTQEAGP